MTRLQPPLPLIVLCLSLLAGGPGNSAAAQNDDVPLCLIGGAHVDDHEEDHGDAARFDPAPALRARSQLATVVTDGTPIFLPDFGSTPDEEPEALLEGVFDVPAPISLQTPPEDDGSIPQATDLGLQAGDRLLVAAEIGDGPFGTAAAGVGASGDFDVYALGSPSAGSRWVVRLDATSGSLFPIGRVLDASGQSMSFVFPGSAVEIESDGAAAYLVVGDISSFLGDPFDSSSGFGAFGEGEYTLDVGLDIADAQRVQVDLRAGDVLETRAFGASRVIVSAPDGAERLISRLSLFPFFVAEGAPFQLGGNVGSMMVCERPGTWTVEVEGIEAGAFDLEIRVHRPALETAPAGTVQTIFLDFDGAVVDRGAIVRGPVDLRTLSPLADFLADWGLAAGDESALIDAVVASFERKVRSLVRASDARGDFDRTGIPGEFALRVLDSAHHADPGDDPYVTRVVVGGTIAELGLTTIGIAPALDVGNYAPDETVIALLDILSGRLPSPFDLNAMPRAPGVSMIDLVGEMLAIIAAHEVGHSMGNGHIGFEPPELGIMQGSPAILQSGLVGPDGLFGTDDDADLRFGFRTHQDLFEGSIDTLAYVAYGASTPVADTVRVDGCDSGVAERFLADDTTLAENLGLCAAASRPLGDGAFVSCSAGFLAGALQAGAKDGGDAGRILACVGPADLDGSSASLSSRPFSSFPRPSFLRP